MGNHKFRLSDIMPNAWFYKLKDMGRGGRSTSLSQGSKKAHPTRTGGSSTPRQFAAAPLPAAKHVQPCYQPGRASYYFPSRQPEKLPTSPAHPRASDTLFPVEPPRKSQKKPRRKHAAKPSTKVVSSGCNCRSGIGSVWRTEAMPEFPPAPESPPYRDDYDGLPCCDKPIIAEHYDFDAAAAWSRPCSCRFTSSAADIILDVGNKGFFAHKSPEKDDLHAVPELGLPPILTKPSARREPEPPEPDGDGNAGSKEKNFHKSEQYCPQKEHRMSSLRRTASGLQGLRMRASSPRLASKKLQAHRHRRAATGSTPRKFLAESCAVVKSSSDPQRDFRDSMVEMIVENNIRTSKDLEELLACYLSLNSNEYHDVIVKVFEQIWFDLTNIN